MAAVMTTSRRLAIVGALLLLAAPAASQDAAPQADGAALFKTYCAMCHDGPAADVQAPRLDTLRRLSPEQVLATLERGSMRSRAAERRDRKSTRLNSSHSAKSRMPSSA